MRDERESISREQDKTVEGKGIDGVSEGLIRAVMATREVMRRRYRGNPVFLNLVEDATQELLTKWTKRLKEGLPQPTPVQIHRSFYNTLVDLYRRERRYLETLSLDEDLQAIVRQYRMDPQPVCGLNDTLTLVEAILAGLEERERLCLTLRFLEGLSLEEVGRRLGGIRADSVSRNINRIIKRIRQGQGV